MGEMAGRSPMGGMFRMVVPRLLGDMDGVTEDRLGELLGVLAERIDWVRFGSATPELLEGPQPPPRLSPVDDVDDTANADPLTTEG